VVLMARLLLAKGWTRTTSFEGAVPAVPAEQLALFPRKTNFEYPAPDGKDLLAFVEADNGRKYYLKDDAGGRPARASEWLCYRLAGMVGIPVPRCDFIQTNAGDIAFGSEALNGASRQAETVIYLETRSLNELGVPVPGLQAALSAIHAFDLFVNNVDRHLGNFLVVPHGVDRRLYAVDFARAFLWRWPWHGFLQPDDLTCQAWVELRERHGFDLSAALAIVNRLGIISVNEIEGVLRQMPTHWLSETMRSELLAYCRDGGWAARVASLREGLGNGSIV
jgi:hypothetical protein